MSQNYSNRLFVAYKSADISSNHFLSKIKRKYRVKKAGFSGTLDPFARGVLIVAFGNYTKLFQFLKKSPKRYIATLFLGAESETLDIERVTSVKLTDPIDSSIVLDTIVSLKGEVEYIPPKYSAKKLDGIRAYTLARDGKDVNLKMVKSRIFDIKLLSYKHPFITFDITISEGGYIRSVAQILSRKLNSTGILSYLERVSEGDFIYEEEKALNPLKFLNLKENYYIGDKRDILVGKKLKIDNLKIKDEGRYFIKLDNIASLIEIKDDKINYLLNGVKIC